MESSVTSLLSPACTLVVRWRALDAIDNIRIGTGSIVADKAGIFAHVHRFVLQDIAAQGVNERSAFGGVEQFEIHFLVPLDKLEQAD